MIINERSKAAMAIATSRVCNEASLVSAGSAALRAGRLLFLLQTEEWNLLVCLPQHRSIPEDYEDAVWAATFPDIASDGFGAGVLTEASNATSLAATPRQAIPIGKVADLNLQASLPPKPSLKDGPIESVAAAVWMAVFLANIPVSPNATASIAAHKVGNSNLADLIDLFAVKRM